MTSFPKTLCFPTGTEIIILEGVFFVFLVTQNEKYQYGQGVRDR